MENNDFIYPYSNQYIHRLNLIAKRRKNSMKEQQNDVINSRAYSSFSIPIQREKGNNARTDERGRSLEIKSKKRSETPNSTRTNRIPKNSIIKRSNSVENLKRSHSPNDKLMRPVLQQQSTVFHEHTRGYRSRSKESSKSVLSSASETHKDVQHTPHFIDPNRYNSPTSSHPILNRVHDSSFQTNEIPSSDIQPKLINFEKREIRSKSQRKKRVGDEVKSSKKDTCPSVPPRSAFVHTKSVKEIQNEKFYVLPVQYSLLSTESTFSTVQHGVIVLPSAVSLAELTTRIQEQFDLPNDFDIILSQRNIDEIHRKNDNHATPAMLQMFPRVCQTLRLSSPSLPTPFITDTTVIHITPCADKIKSTENIFTPPINSKSSAILDLQKLPVDGVDSSYRKKLLQTPKCGTLKPEPNAMKFSEVPITIKPDIGENISQREFNVDGILVESIEPNLSRESSRTHSPAQRKGIFNYTEIDAVKSDEESISLTIDGTVETENIEIEEEEEKDHLTQPQHELIDVFHHPDYLVTQLFNERKSQKFHPTEFPSKPLLEIDTQLHETVKRPIRNGIYSFHPPIDSFRKISEAQTPLSLPPSPSSSQLLTPIISDSPRHDEPKDQQNSFHDNFQWNENPSEPSELLNDTSPRLRTTPTTTKSFQFRQYYENFVKERKARELSSQLI